MKLTVEEYHVIKLEHKNGSTQTKIAKEFGVSQSTISQVCKTNTYMEYLSKFSKRQLETDGSKKAKNKKVQKRGLFAKIKAIFK